MSEEDVLDGDSPTTQEVVRSLAQEPNTDVIIYYRSVHAMHLEALRELYESSQKLLVVFDEELKKRGVALPIDPDAVRIIR